MVGAYHLGGRLGTSHAGLGEIVRNGTVVVEREEVGTCRNGVALLKIRGSLLQKIGFYFITKTHAKAGRVLVWADRPRTSCTDIMQTAQHHRTTPRRVQATDIIS